MIMLLITSNRIDRNSIFNRILFNRPGISIVLLSIKAAIIVYMFFLVTGQGRQLPEKTVCPFKVAAEIGCFQYLCI
ncbi:MAG: hypothetical protein DSY90_09400 [Deltaproteobacteria bacterium]|nr:MAG: hypothetical protein DSY90_09400 [Deltaproteobacteria bacterium]